MPLADYELIGALKQRCLRDLAAGRSEHDIDPDGPAAGIDCKPMLTAEYLVENERMADLMRDLTRRGLLAPLRR